MASRPEAKTHVKEELRKMCSIGYRRKLHNEDFHDVHLSPNFNWIINSRSVGWAGSVACMGEIVMRTRVWWKTVKDKDLLVDLDIDREIVKMYRKAMGCGVEDWIHLT
jgi:hypothetical protein